MHLDDIPAKTIVSAYQRDGWFGAQYTMNIYKGCSHGCIYCDSRSDCYRVEHFDIVRAKQDALSVIERDLRGKQKKGMLLTGAMSDAYNPREKELLLTRGALALADRNGFGIAIDTKSDLVLRDIDLLRGIRRHSPAAVSFTITAADDALCQQIERHVCPTSARLAAMKKLAEADIPCGVLLMPTLPFVTDSPENILGIVRRAKEAGASWIYCGYGFGVTLRANQREHFLREIERVFPGMRARYEQAYGFTYSCPAPDHDALWPLFTAECERLGLAYHMRDIAEQIWAPYQREQTSLF